MKNFKNHEYVNTIHKLDLSHESCGIRALPSMPNSAQTQIEQVKKAPNKEERPSEQRPIRMTARPITAWSNPINSEGQNREIARETKRTLDQLLAYK
ncbi:hypothetical protein AT1G48953 [Arabidopsis thaliana]|uniref:Uncharacterized protein n=1 Tax=Arabidopsis thaliana TaxID=3702 RepID=B3H5J2_ARATH|nr:uncharacterized protein AT1G48953 [Arabidopsis thaliana]AEE32371.1 hypothetical protein AT1G48953 [Arabidopsis thaliana]|eukprot:NP_001117454.1 hypothetical protein AT1G48953 [Arabidopsis thaliana]